MPFYIKPLIAFMALITLALPASAQGRHGHHGGGRDRVIIDNSGSTTPVLGTLAALMLLKSLSAPQQTEFVDQAPARRYYRQPPPLK